MRMPLALITLLSIAGCATAPAVTEFQGPDGTKMKTVKCASDSQKCFFAASQSCPDRGTYRVVSSESHAGGLLADVLPGPVTWYGMTYACGPSDGTMPDFKFQGQRYTPPPPPTKVIVEQPARRSTTTSCSTIGNMVNCTTN